LIVLDTHIWIWWIQGTPQLTADLARKIAEHEESGLIVSAISLLEVSRATALGGLSLPVGVREWLDIASGYPGIRIASLEPAIATEAYRLPGEFHKDPADRLIVATARVMNCPILTLDEKILAYTHVRHA
jgi:PIN domain nuclease of toxin-antitoxin system